MSHSAIVVAGNTVYYAHGVSIVGAVVKARTVVRVLWWSRDTGGLEGLVSVGPTDCQLCGLPIRDVVLRADMIATLPPGSAAEWQKAAEQVCTL